MISFNERVRQMAGEGPQEPVLRHLAVPGDADANSDGPAIAPELTGMQEPGLWSLDAPADDATPNGGRSDTQQPTTSVPDASKSCDHGDGSELVLHGWVPLWRAFIDTWWWLEKPWSTAHVFLYLFASANVKPRTTKFCGRVITIGRGCVATSFSALAERSGLSRKVVTRILDQFAEGGEITIQQRDTHGILLSICHYETYAFPVTPSGTASGQRPANRRRNSGRQ